MKLRSLLLTAALFLSAGIASAEIFENTTTGGIMWEKPASATSVNIHLQYYGQDGFTFAVYDTNKLSALTSDTWKDYKQNKTKYAGIIWELEEGDNKIPISTVAKGLGVIGMNGNSAQQIVYSTTNIRNNPGWKFYVSENNDLIAFDKTADSGTGNYAAEITFGAPLPAPVVTLLIALGFGAALVMYRNRKQVKA